MPKANSVRGTKGSAVPEEGIAASTPAKGVIELKYQKAREARARKLSSATGWNWSPLELSHFYSPAKAQPPELKAWRAETLSSLQISSPDLLDLGVQRIREFLRILSTLYPGSRSDASLESIGKLDAAALVLERLNPFSELRSAEDNVPLENDLVPDFLRCRLFQYLDLYSSDVCEVDDPRCEECELARFCNSYRNHKCKVAAVSESPRVIDLFCGAGGMSAGFERAGFNTVCAVDSNPDACRTFWLNHPAVPDASVINGDITEDEIRDKILNAPGASSADVLLGGPPCQGFSRSGFSSSRALRARRLNSGFGEEDDERNYLFEDMIEIAASLRPKVIVMENVPGMDAGRGALPSFMHMAELMLNSMKYTTDIWNIDAASFGVPQHRLRKFLVASLAPVTPALPEPDYRGKLQSMNHQDDLLQPISLNQAIQDLPEISIDDGDEVQLADYTIESNDRFLRHFISRKYFPIRGNEKLIYNHRSRYNNDRDAELFAILREGEDSFDVVKKHGRSDLMKYRKDAFHDKYFRLRGDVPSRTIVSHLGQDGNGFIHPSQVRTITPRECARLQSFPDSYIFCGPASSQWKQIGNAVPPLLAFSIANSINEHLERFFGK